MKYISNAFSLQMVPRHLLASVRIAPCERPPMPSYMRPDSGLSIVGHADTARVLGVQFNRESVTLQPGDSLFVAQLVGGRLPEGATTLPEGARFEWVMVWLPGEGE